MLELFTLSVRPKLRVLVMSDPVASDPVADLESSREAIDSEPVSREILDAAALRLRLKKLSPKPKPSPMELALVLVKLGPLATLLWEICV